MGTTTTIGATRKAVTRSASVRGSMARASAPQAVKPREAVVDPEHHGGRDQEHHRDGGREAPGEQLFDLLVDELRDHHVAWRAEQHRRDEETKAGDEHEEPAVDDAGQAERQEYLAEGGPGPCPTA